MEIDFLVSYYLVSNSFVYAGDEMTLEKAQRLATATVWSEQANQWVCAYCCKTPTTFYVATGHDHTDWDIKYCECREKQNATD